MTRQQIEASLQDLNNLMQEGKLLEAFDKYYHDDVQMQENELPPTVSKAANRKREEEFLSNIVESRNAEVKGLSVGDDISSTVWHFDYTHKEWGVRNYTQANIQRWKDGKIIHEQFFYGN